MKYCFSVLILFWGLFGFAQQDEIVVHDKIQGISLVGEREALKSSQLEPVVSLGADYAAVIPFAFMPSLEKGEVYYDNKMQWEGERISGVRTAIRLLKEKGIRVMVKPQIWVGHGQYTGKIKMTSNKEWRKFEEQYMEYIVAFAKVAEEEGADLFSIGTELQLVVAERPEYFSRLISACRIWFTGKLTYAENWDCYDKVQFWDQLDFIGVDAYFPISEQATLDVELLKEGWKPVINDLKVVSEKWGKRILFTEFGYRSIVGCTVKPWDYSKDGTVISEAHQEAAFEALFESVWNESFFAGGFLWKWYPDHEHAGGANDSMFTIQNKAAEKVVRRWFK